MTFVISTLTAYVAVDPEDGDEGICGVRTCDGWMPLIGADEARIRSLRPAAERVARESGRVIKLARFSVREDLEEIKPE